MADGQHKRSRRALLGAVCAAPVLSRHPGLNPGSMNTALVKSNTAVFMDSGFRRNDEWDRALARVQPPAAARPPAAAPAPPPTTADEVLSPRRGPRHTDALSALLRSPAPDLPALA